MSAEYNYLGHECNVVTSNSFIARSSKRLLVNSVLIILFQYEIHVQCWCEKFLEVTIGETEIETGGLC
jgi:hypothetical protein